MPIPSILDMPCILDMDDESMFSYTTWTMTKIEMEKLKGDN